MVQGLRVFAKELIIRYICAIILKEDTEKFDLRSAKPVPAAG